MGGGGWDAAKQDAGKGTIESLGAHLGIDVQHGAATPATFDVALQLIEIGWHMSQPWNDQSIER